jgi:hypothetical protein
MSATSKARMLLEALQNKRPDKKSTQVRALWPEIKTALDNGHSLRSICECLAADGLNISVESLPSYISRIRRRQIQERRPDATVGGYDAMSGAQIQGNGTGR